MGFHVMFLPFRLSVLLFLLLFSGAAGAQVHDPVQLALMDLLENRSLPSNGEADLRVGEYTVDQWLVELYAQRDMHPLWVDENGPGSRAFTIASTIIASFDEGLDPDDYHAETISRLWNSDDSSELALLDVLLTNGLSSYAADMALGRTEPCMLDPQLFATARQSGKNNPLERVLEAYRADDLDRYLDSLKPSHSAYGLLRDALSAYRTIAGQGGWPAIPGGPSIRRGMKDPRLPGIRRRLAITGDFSGTDLYSPIYDAELAVAVMHFQKRHNLEIDGIIGRNTLAAMNVPVEERISQILINMERWRWQPHRLDDRRVYVNIAGFYLHAMNREEIELAMPVIVGEVYHKTPVFSDRIRYIEFNPYWNIPDSIARNEILPELIKNPAYLQENNIRIFEGWAENAPELDGSFINWEEIGRHINRYRFRQDPGPDNSLGRVKFVFPNRYSVFLHDTPRRELFKHDNRAFSHGCIRVSEPLAFAGYLLAQDDSSWDMERINKILDEEKRTIVVLKNPIPIHILYRTVIVDPETSTISFFTDVYGRDELLRQALYPEGSTEICQYPPLAPR
ncbi:MAG: L,D-transpeptidase family protein [Desulfobulbaceae bacterium]